MNTSNRFVRFGTFVALGLLLMLTFWGCGTTTGSFGILQFQGTSTAGRLAAFRSGRTATVDVLDKTGTKIGTLTIEDARVALKEVKVQFDSSGSSTPEEEQQDQESKFPGPYVVDLLANTAMPTIPKAALLPGTYRQIELKLDKIQGDELDATGAPLVAPTDALFGNSVHLSGKYSGPYAGGTATDMPFTMTYDFDQTFTLTPPGTTSAGFTVNPGDNKILVAFRFPRWFDFGNTATNDKNVDLSEAVDTAGALVFDESATGVNADIRAVLKQAITASTDYGVDTNDDGVLSADEDDEP